MFAPEEDDCPWESAQWLLQGLLDRYLTFAALLCANEMAEDAWEDAYEFMDACKQAAQAPAPPTVDRRRLLR